LTITSWRLVTRRFAKSAFDGDGARIGGGRWNKVGNRAVYTAATTSLGLLELLVHSSGTRLLPSYIAIPVVFDERIIDRIDRTRLSKNWRLNPFPRETQVMGDEWLVSGHSCILEVPSAIVPHESNYILNPKHPEFASLEIGQPISLEIDDRLV
jgi:RES domain-containing protein